MCWVRGICCTNALRYLLGRCHTGGERQSCVAQPQTFHSFAVIFCNCSIYINLLDLYRVPCSKVRKQRRQIFGSWVRSRNSMKRNVNSRKEGGSSQFVNSCPTRRQGWRSSTLIRALPNQNWSMSKALPCLSSSSSTKAHFPALCFTTLSSLCICRECAESAANAEGLCALDQWLCQY